MNGNGLGNYLFGAAADLEEHETDAMFDVLLDVMFDDHDVLMLFDDRFANGFPASVVQMAGIVNMDVVDWFEPFNPQDADALVYLHAA